MFINEKHLKEKEWDLRVIEAGKQGSHHEWNCPEEGWRQILLQNMQGQEGPLWLDNPRTQNLGGIPDCSCYVGAQGLGKVQHC